MKFTCVACNCYFHQNESEMDLDNKPNTCAECWPKICKIAKDNPHMVIKSSINLF